MGKYLPKKDDKKSVQEQKKDKDKEETIINLKKFFALVFIGVDIKIFVNWIDNNKLTNISETEEIIKILNGKKNQVIHLDI